MNLVFIYGPPGVGKLTIAKKFAQLTGYKLFHNHHTQDMVYPLFGYKGEQVTTLLSDIRMRIFEEAMKSNLNLIFTTCFEHPEHIEFIQDLKEKAQEHNANIHFVRLFCDFEEQCKRVASPSRKNHPTKTKTAEGLKWAVKEKNIDSRIDFLEKQLEIDNTNVPPETVAEMICQHYEIEINKQATTDFSY